MAGWADVAWGSVNGGTPFESYCRVVQDMLRTTLNFRDYKEYGQLRLPLLSVASGSPYTPEQLKDGVLTLLALNIHSFVVLESSTYCLTLLCQLLDLPKFFPDLKVSITVADSYHFVINSKWGLPHNLDGLVIKLTKTR